MSSVDTSTSTRLFVGGLAYALTEFQLLKVCKRFGTIANLHFPHEKLSGKPMGFAFVEFETHSRDPRNSYLEVAPRDSRRLYLGGTCFTRYDVVYVTTRRPNRAVVGTRTKAGAQYHFR